jgi:DNA-directed RNA polymerase beta' subunit
MKYRIEKGSPKMYQFIVIVIFLVLASSYQLYNYLQTNQFVYEFPGDWDKPLGITVGLFLIIQSTKFISESRELFIEISENQLTYRTIRTGSVRKIALSNIKKIQEKNKKIILETEDSTKLTIINFNKVRVRPEIRESIRKSLIELI